MSRDPFKDDRKACLVAALKDQDGRCFWCRCTLAVLDDVRNKLRFKCVSHHSATIVAADGQTDILYIASADHLVPQSMGGWTDRDNIVASCKPCNEDRGQLHNRAFWYVVDVSGFEAWRNDVCRERGRRLRAQKAKQPLTASMRPTLQNALKGANVIKLERRKTA